MMGGRREVTGESLPKLAWSLSLTVTSTGTEVAMKSGLHE